ncbi:MAG: ROK family transcriptional regulator [Ignavibacteria bacterium]|nr:MAG: ROK family transcriptional regulator [Ignavibacteria bacterium]
MFTSTNKPLSNLPAASLGLDAGSALHTDAPAGINSKRALTDIVLELIWRERRISRADIARRTSLARSTVSDIVRKLLRTGLVAEVGTDRSSGGRRPVVLEFQDDAFNILGVDFGATHISVVLTNLRGRILAWREQKRPADDADPENSRTVVMELCDECIDEWGKGARSLIGIGVSVPSPVDPRHLSNISDVVLPAWRGRIGLEQLHRRYGVPVLVDNDANLGALAEGWWGAGRDVRDFTYIKVATGIGAGIILGGEIYRGSTGVAGELGHLAIDANGDPCVCGLRGCLATFIGTDALLARADSLRSQKITTRLTGDPLTIFGLEDAAREGDPLAVQVVEEAAEHLGVAVAGLLNVMNPSMVILGGSLTRAGELLLDRLRSIVRDRTFATSVAATDICIGELGPRAVALGASTLVLNAAFADPTLFSSSRFNQVRK